LQVIRDSQQAVDHNTAALREMTDEFKQRPCIAEPPPAAAAATRAGRA